MSASSDHEQLMLQGILKIASEGIIVVDARQRILLFSPGAERIFGYRADEVLGGKLDCLIPKRHRAAHEGHVRRFSEGRRDHIVMFERRQLYGLRRNGEEFPMEASLSKLQTAEGVMFTTLVRDTTERHESEARLRRSEERLRIALATAGAEVFEFDLAADAVTWAGAPSAAFGLPARLRDPGRDVWACLHPDDRRAARTAWRRHIVEKRPFRMDVRLQIEPGGEVWAHASAQLIRDAAGRPQRVLGSLKDITERRRAELAANEAAAAAQSANAAKSAFLATMSHEIRTPLNGMLGMAQALAADELTPVQRERVAVMRDSGDALLAILNDVLDLSKIEAGKLEVERCEFDFAELVRGARATFAASALKKGLSFELDVARAEGVYRGDPTRIRQVLYNLVSNAIKFTDVGRVRVECVHDGGELRLTVADTGIGIAPEALDGLFTAFVQADSSMTRRFGGSGLGLTITKKLVELMGGTLSAASKPGRGAVFTVRLPLARSLAAASRDNASASPPLTPSPGVRILVAEDNPTNQFVIKTLLEQLGVAPIVVENGLKAVRAWEAESYDAVLMDVQMPVLDGPAATRLIRRREAMSGRGPTPIIGLTANAMSHQIAEYAAAGMDRVLTKPIHVQELALTLQQVLDRASGDAAPVQGEAERL